MSESDSFSELDVFSTVLYLNVFKHSSSPSHGHSLVHGNSADLQEQRPKHILAEQWHLTNSSAACGIGGCVESIGCNCYDTEWLE